LLCTPKNTNLITNEPVFFSFDSKLTIIPSSKNIKKSRQLIYCYAASNLTLLYKFAGPTAVSKV